ncbi:hypothetical protein J2T60_002058 [Natronospira proteinivora]|uniref:Uncharacterized protein n=1 Tax=Natronospira proteinivora TaxID=1807133 RepID=A0ABT1GCG4_9GAMM|nr:hypothetical protein [Natronospira proteinivora]MCP1728058.1 hypothetical protein [Natronospira proteinivora]
MASQDVVRFPILRKPAGRMPDGVLKPLFQIPITVVSRQQRGLVLPEIVFHHLAVDGLGDTVTQSIVLILNMMLWGDDLFQPALAVIAVLRDLAISVMFFAEAAVAVVLVADVAIGRLAALELIGQVVLGGFVVDPAEVWWPESWPPQSFPTIHTITDNNEILDAHRYQKTQNIKL